MTVMAETLTRKYNAYRNDKVGGTRMALRNVGYLLDNKLTHEAFDGVTEHIISAGTDESIPADRKAFNEGYLEMLETLMDLE